MPTSRVTKPPSQKKRPNGFNPSGRLLESTGHATLWRSHASAWAARNPLTASQLKNRALRPSVAQLPPQDFADIALRQLRAKLDQLRTLVSRQLRFAE